MTAARTGDWRHGEAARITLPGIRHHVTQRGNRRERIFLEPGDEALYLDLMSTQLKRHDVACRAYCLMPNHVHFILTPADEPGLARAVGEAHRRYAAFVGARGRWTGLLFQARCASVADERSDAARWSDLLRAEQVGRPVGAKAWIEHLEKEHDRTLSPAKRGPKPRLTPSPQPSGELFGD